MKIAYCPSFSTLSLEQVVQQLSSGEMTPITCVNWPLVTDYCPDARVSIARDDARVYIMWRVQGEKVRCVSTLDLQPVWEDSCCEFFITLPDGRYMNLECNAIGAMTSSRRVERKVDVQYLTPAEFARIERYSSLPHEVIDSQEPMDYTLAIAVPMDLIGLDAQHLPEHIMANVYKCGDKTARMHFVSLFPIAIPQPDFHRPDFFQAISLRP